jgi:hypothetical protein
VVDCTPYNCGTNACDTSCSAAAGGCAPGILCDTGSSTCCAGPGNSGTLAVDSVTGDDTAACCGTGTKKACQTLTHSMSVIDIAQATNVTLTATVNGIGGDWAPAGETYPVVLGWGVELNAPGVFFLNSADTSFPGPHKNEILDVNFYSANDTVGYASIVGSALSAVGVGMNITNTLQTDDVAAIAVEDKNTLYIANASVNGSLQNIDNLAAILVQPGGTLILAQDQSAAITGTVTIGNSLGGAATDGFTGLTAATDMTSKGGTINDAVLRGPVHSVVIEGQEGADIEADDFASVTLSTNPQLGVAPPVPGFNQCTNKNDGMSVNAEAALWVNGQATVSISNGTVQCIGGNAVQLLTSPNGNGNPTVTLAGVTIQNTDVGIRASAGSLAVTKTTLNYNYIGVLQETDGTNNGAIDLSGGENTVVCSSNVESSAGATAPGIDVYNLSTANLKADNVTWDTAGPDYFSCSATTCTCLLDGGCTTDAGADDMDAVEDSTKLGGITTTGNSQATTTCN